jgi:hypothetical protein
MGGEEIDEGAGDVCSAVVEGDEVAGLDWRAVVAQFAVGMASFETLAISIILRFDFKVIPRHIFYRHVFSICSSQFMQLHICMARRQVDRGDSCR